MRLLTSGVAIAFAMSSLIFLTIARGVFDCTMTPYQLLAS